jgi:hypothetical protein
MTIKTIGDLKKVIQDIDNNKEFVVSSDEELNNIYSRSEICELTLDDDKKVFAIFGYSGSEIEQ